MPRSTKNDILIGIFFVLAGLILNLCDQWALHTKVTGKPIIKEHYFNHLFFVWTLKQILLACLLPLWKMIDSDFLGMGRFHHAEFDIADRRNNPPPNAPIDDDDDDNHNAGNNRHRGIEQLPVAANNALGDVNDLLPINDEIPGHGGNDHQHLIQGRQFRRRPKKYTKMLFFPPAVFNQAYIILIYFGMRLTYPSSIFMLKGTEPIFVFLLALAFLAQQIAVFMWVGVILMAIGFAISGLSDYIHIVPDGYEAYGIAAGDLLFTMGQITLATRVIYEEKFMRKLSIHPMKFLGAEAIYSMVFSIIILMIFNLVDTVEYTQLPNYRIEDIVDAFYQLSNSWRASLSVFGSVISYVIYMYLGMLIIKEHGAVARVMISMLSPAIYWAIALGLRWQNFYITQIPGLVLIPCGLLIYSRILVFPCLRCHNTDGDIGPNNDYLNDEEEDRIEGGNPDEQQYNEALDDENLIQDGANNPDPAEPVMDDELLIQA